MTSYDGPSDVNMSLEDGTNPRLKIVVFHLPSVCEVAEIRTQCYKSYAGLLTLVERDA